MYTGMSETSEHGVNDICVCLCCQ